MRDREDISGTLSGQFDRLKDDNVLVMTDDTDDDRTLNI